VLKASLLAGVGYFGAAALSHISDVRSTAFVLTPAVAIDEATAGDGQRFAAFVGTGSLAGLSLAAFVAAGDATAMWSAATMGTGAALVLFLGRQLPTGDLHPAQPIGVAAFAAWILFWARAP
jgi:hypothetical protein